MTSTTLASALAEACTQHADRPAIVWGAQTMSYGELGQATSRLASAYRALGIVGGSRIVCHLPNRPELLVAAVAAWRSGAVHCGADADLSPVEVLWRIDHTSAAAFVTQPSPTSHDPMDLIRRVRQAHPHLPILVLGEAEGCLSLGRIFDQPAASDALPDPGPGDPAVFLFTSGTTAAPKVVVRYHGQLLRGWNWLGDAFGARSGDVHLAQLPLSHGFGFGLAVATLLRGGAVVLMERFSPDEALRLITEHRVTVLPGTPTHFHLLTEHLGPAHDVASLRIGVGSAARFPKHIIEGVFDRLQMDFLLLYGSSEGLGWSTTDRQDILRGSVGRPDARSVRIQAPDGTEVSTGEIGEIVLHKAHPVHYWEGDGSTTDVDPGEWYYSGDLGRVDAEGRLYVLGRVRQQVNRGGIRIDPGEVEAVLSQYQGLDRAAVVGLPHAVLGEIVCLCLVAGEGEPPALEEVRVTLATSLARHKLPEALCVVPEIPRTVLGKIDREALRSMAMAADSVVRRRG